MESQRFIAMSRTGCHLFHILRQMIPGHIIPSSFFKICLSSGLFPSVFLTKILCALLSSTIQCHII